MSSERTPKRHRIDEVTPSFRRQLFHSSDSPTSSSMDVDSSSDNHMATTYAGTSGSPPSMASVVCVDHELSTVAVAGTEAHRIVSVPVTAPISAVTRRSGIPGPETPETPPTHMLPITHVPMSPSADVILQDNLESTESERPLFAYPAFWLGSLCKRPEYTHQWRYFC
ncbi:hypothetical protein BYT27DRAFT_6904718 [Phlegmacium glaucopus]|nr:hypothetical protein BYT27DRAFT_6904718 [Phlegmacium glaucopus]